MWHSVVRQIIESDTGNLVELAKIAGQDPTFFYRYVSLSGVDVRGQDLSGLDLTGTDLSSATMDHQTIIDPEFDPRAYSDSVRRSIRIPRNLYICVRTFESDTHYVYTGWAIKRLIENAFFATRRAGFARSWTAWLSESRSGQHIISQGGGHSFSLKLRSEYYDELANEYRFTGGASKAIRFAILIGLFQHWHATPDLVGAGSILEFLQRVRKRPRADATLLSLAKTWSDYN